MGEYIAGDNFDDDDVGNDRIRRSGSSTPSSSSSSWTPMEGSRVSGNRGLASFFQSNDRWIVNGGGADGCCCCCDSWEASHFFSSIFGGRSWR